ncbi:MAG: S-layer homology domain-containing protein [Bacillota bacterium]|nr:S-layer homology domain-containing protein [Bacillota bacterium]
MIEQICRFINKGFIKAMFLAGIMIMIFFTMQLPANVAWGEENGFSVIGFTAIGLLPEDTLVQLDFSNGFDKALEANLEQVRVFPKNDNTTNVVFGYEYIKDGNKTSEGGKTRQLELTFDSLEATTDYIVEIGADFKTNKGIALGKTYSFEFTTSASTQTNGNGIEKETADGEGTIAEGINVTDITGHWAEPVITEAINRGLADIIVYKDGTFKPNQAITRAEITALLVKAAGIEADKSNQVFDDVIDHWAQEYVAIAAAKGIIQGYDEKTFGPDENLTREQMAVIIARAAKWQAGGATTIFSDADQISEWAKEAVGAAVANKAIEGYEDNTFRPKNNITRAEAVTVILRVF